MYVLFYLETYFFSSIDWELSTFLNKYLKSIIFNFPYWSTFDTEALVSLILIYNTFRISICVINWYISTSVLFKSWTKVTAKIINPLVQFAQSTITQFTAAIFCIDIYIKINVHIPLRPKFHTCCCCTVYYPVNPEGMLLIKFQMSQDEPRLIYWTLDTLVVIY